MVSAKKYGTTKRFGPRYGRRLKQKVGEIEEEERKKHLCPYCRAKKVKRLAAGIWHCDKCNSKFTGKAYSIRKKIMFKEKAEETATDGGAQENIGSDSQAGKEAAQNDAL